MKIVILAGGSGTRLWPVSRKNNPKQVQPFIDDDTLLQKTYTRLRKNFDAHDIYISTGGSFKDEIKNQLPELVEQNLILEPMKKDTAIAMGLAAVKFYFHNPEEIMVNIHSDHFIKNEDEYLRILKLAEDAVKQNPNKGVLIGVKTEYPETGYGYIKMKNKFIKINQDEIWRVDKFIEKPNLNKAREYFNNNNYLWNPGYGVWQVNTLLKQFKKYLPEIYQSLVKINLALSKINEEDVINEEFKKIKPISFDYGINEKSKDLLVIPADFGFSDVGHWRSIKDILKKDKKNNIIKGRVIQIDSNDNLIYNFTKQVVSTVGLKNMIVVVTDDATLICHQDNAQDVKKVVEKLKKMGMEDYL